MTGTIGSGQYYFPVFFSHPVKIPAYNVLWLEEDKGIGEQVFYFRVFRQDGLLDALRVIDAVYNVFVLLLDDLILFLQLGSQVFLCFIPAENNHPEQADHAERDEEKIAVALLVTHKFITPFSAEHPDDGVIGMVGVCSITRPY